MFTFIGFGNYIKTALKKWGHGPILFDQKMSNFPKSKKVTVRAVRYRLEKQPIFLRFNELFQKLRANPIKKKSYIKKD